jgi:hypothetical protein
MPIALSTIYLLTIEFNQRIKYIFYATVAVFLSFSWLIDPRYYIIPFSFFILFKKEESKKVELLTIISYILISILILFNTLNNSFFI